MNQRREIDESDVDLLLMHLTDLQVANVFGLSVHEVFELRRARRRVGSYHQLQTRDAGG